ncbi:hypothetical protein ACH5RR_039067 [Cinchona calisaya]|uniref:Uncharacterized protein n=1 Tax=Cinchona calisaya TaxID=153742 RepID=A0ABD2Y0L3_9GENT
MYTLGRIAKFCLKVGGGFPRDTRDNKFPRLVSIGVESLDYKSLVSSSLLSKRRPFFGSILVRTFTLTLDDCVAVSQKLGLAAEVGRLKASIALDPKTVDLLALVLEGLVEGCYPP